MAPQPSGASVSESQRQVTQSLWLTACSRFEKSEEGKKRLRKLNKTMANGRSDAWPANIRSEQGLQQLKDIVEEETQSLVKKREGSSIAKLGSALKHVTLAKQILSPLSVEPHAAIGLSVVSCILPVLENVTEQEPALVAAVEASSRLMIRIESEEDFLHQTAEAAKVSKKMQNLHRSIKKGIEKFYERILAFLARAAYYLRSHPAKQYGKNMIKYDDWEGMTAEFKDFGSEISGEMAALDRARNLQPEKLDKKDLAKQISTSIEASKGDNVTKPAHSTQILITRLKQRGNEHVRQEDIQQLLSDGGQDFAALSSSNRSRILGIAVSSDWPAVVSQLLTQEVDVNHKTPHGWYFVHRAAGRGHSEVLRHLLTHPKVRVDCLTNRGLTALHLAASEGCEDAVRCLIQSGADVNKKTTNRGWTALQLAAENGHFRAVEELLAHSQTQVNAVNDQGRTALHVTVEKGHTKVVKTLLKNGAQLEKKTLNYGRMALHIAAEEGHLNIVKELLGYPGIQVDAVNDKQCRTALHFAAEKGHTEVIKALLKYGAQPNEKTFNQKRTALHIAAEKDHPDVVYALLASSKTQVDAVNDHGRTALHITAEKGHEKILKALLKHGAEVGKKTLKRDSKALQLAAEKGHLELVNILLAKNDIEIDATNCDGRTALHLAAQKGHQAVVQSLLKHGAELEKKTPKSGWTALHLASEKDRNEAVVKYLLEQGADRNSRIGHGDAPKGRTAMEVAEKKHCEKILKVLREAETRA